MDGRISPLHGRVVPEGSELIQTCSTAESRCWVATGLRYISCMPAAWPASTRHRDESLKEIELTWDGLYLLSAVDDLQSSMLSP